MPRDDGFTYPGQYQSGIVSRRVAFTNADTELDLGVPCSTISISVEAGADLHVDWSNSTATTSDAKITGGSSFTYQGPPLQKIRHIGSGNGNLNVVAY
jgi:hypothetical protein